MRHVFDQLHTVRGLTTTGVYFPQFPSLLLKDHENTLKALSLGIGLAGTLLESQQNGYSWSQAGILFASYCASTAIANTWSKFYLFSALPAISDKTSPVKTFGACAIVASGITIAGVVISVGTENVSKAFLSVLFNSPFPEPGLGRG